MTTDRTALLADKYIGRNGEQPAIRMSIQRMACTACGAEANASRFVQLRSALQARLAAGQRLRSRAAAADLGVSHQTVSQARKSGVNHLTPARDRAGVNQSPPASHDAPETVTGRDGKEYPARKSGSWLVIADWLDSVPALALKRFSNLVYPSRWAHDKAVNYQPVWIVSPEPFGVLQSLRILRIARIIY